MGGRLLTLQIIGLRDMIENPDAPEISTARPQKDSSVSCGGLPFETGDFLPSDLVDLASYDPRLRLDIRYATPANFTGMQVYPEPRAFLQRPAAEALRRIHDGLLAEGFGLIIYDGYRPWSVTSLFWDVTPAHQKEFVADPARGSRHNRGCAVDLTLLDINTGLPAEMPTDYDEFTHRSYPSYDGGTELSRQNREVLRRAMEAEGFSMYAYEWWHFDFQGWERYRIMDIPFAEIPAGL